MANQDNKLVACPFCGGTDISDSREAKIVELETDLAAIREKLFTNGDRSMTMKDRVFTLEGDGIILDNNFDFDATLKVSGDFVDDEKNQYAQMIIANLNAKLVEE